MCPRPANSSAHISSTASVVSVGAVMRSDVWFGKILQKIYIRTFMGVDELSEETALDGKAKRRLRRAARRWRGRISLRKKGRKGWGQWCPVLLQVKQGQFPLLLGANEEIFPAANALLG